MKKLILICGALYLSGCGSAQLVSTRYRPVKSGTVRLDIPGPAQRGMVMDQAKEIMVKFCSPLRPEIVGTDTSEMVTGTVQNAYGLRGYTANQTQTVPFIHFECVSGSKAEPEPKESITKDDL